MSKEIRQSQFIEQKLWTMKLIELDSGTGHIDTTLVGHEKTFSLLA